MDPSGFTGPYAPGPEESELYQEQFPGYTIKPVFTTVGPQKYRADTLCQTWSLAWLMGDEDEDLARAVNDAAKSDQRPFYEMRTILDTFRNILSRPPYTRNAVAVKWLQAYNDIHLYLEQYFWITPPTEVTRPRSVTMQELRRET